MNLWKGLALFAALVCFAAPSFGQGSVYQNQVFGPTGAPKGGATITVCNNAGNTLATCPGPNNVNVATIYSNQTLTLPLANPLTADGLGNFTFYAPSGIYYYTVTGAGTTSPGPYIAILYCIPNGSCGLGTQFPWTNLASSATPTITVGNGNVNYYMNMFSNVTAVTFAGNPHDGDYLGIYFFNTNGSSISTGVFPANVQFPPTFSFTIGTNKPYLMGWTYDASAIGGPAWIPTPQWGGGGVGSSFYQTVMQAGATKPQEPKLNFLAPVTATDNPGNNSTDINIPLNYQTILNNAVLLPVEPKFNVVPPLVAADNPGNSRTDITCPAAVGVGGSHASGCVPDPTASGATTDYLGRDMNYHTATSAATVKPDPSVSVQYAAGICNGGSACVDGNDGLSWGTAKLTISAALQALPNGNSTTAGSGTVFVGHGAVSNAAGSQYGIWIMGPNDPNFSSPPTGWLKEAPNGAQIAGINIIGVPDASGGPNGHAPRVNINASGGGSDTNHPAVWLSGVNNSTWIQNLQFNYPGRAFVIGECSTHLRNDTCQSSAITFENVGGIVNSAITSNGPCTDIVGGAFFVFFHHFGCTGLGSAAAGGITANNAAGMLLDGTLDTGDGIQISDSNFGGGGIKVIPGSNGFSLYASSITLEGDFTHALPPAVWITSYFTGCDARLDEITTADAGGGSMPPIEIDGGYYGNAVGGPTTLSGSISVGQASQVNPVYAYQATVDPIRYGSSGFYNKYMVGQSNVARRIGGLTPTRFVNQADANTANWTFTNIAGVQTLTQGLTDPFGGTGAAKISSTSATLENLQLGSCFSYSPTVGDWLIIGVWEQNVSNTNDLFVAGCTGSSPPTQNEKDQMKGMIAGDGNWEFIWTAYHISGGSPMSMGAAMLFSSAFTPTLYGPVMYVIPNGTISNNEVFEFASTMNSIDKVCAVGSVCNVAGHPVSVDTLNLRFSTFTGSLVPGTLTANRTYTHPDASGIVPLFTGSITNAANVCASGTLGLVTTVGCTGGGGSGTITASQQFNPTYYSGNGSSSTVNGTTAPTGPNSVFEYYGEVPAANQATAPIFALPGIPGRTTAVASGVGADIVATDRVSRVEYTNAGAVTVNIPAPGSAGFGSSIAFQAKSRGAGSVVTFTPGAGTCNGGATCVLRQGQVGTFKSVDNINLFMDAHESPITCSTNLVCTRSDYGLTLSSTAGGGTLTNVAASLPAGKLITGNTYPDVVAADLTGDCSTSGTTATTCTRLNGGSFAGASGDLVSFGAANIPADSGVVAANTVTAGSNYTSGDLVQAAGNNKTTSDSGVIAANVTTATSAAAAAKQIPVSSGPNKAFSYIDFPQQSYIPAANCNNTSAGAGWSIGSGGAVNCRTGTNNRGGYIQITDTAATFATFQFHIPKDWDAATNPYISFDIASTDATSSHTIIPSIQVACYKGDGSTTDDVAPNAVHSLSTITLTSTTNQYWSTSNVQMNATDMTGCVGGSLMQVTVGRATDTATNAEFYGASITVPRLLTVQAN